MICPAPRAIASDARVASVRRNFTLRSGSSHRGPSRVAHAKPWRRVSRAARRALGSATSDGSVSFCRMFGPVSSGPKAQMLRLASRS
jgi:hypothetical protein